MEHTVHPQNPRLGRWSGGAFVGEGLGSRFRFQVYDAFGILQLQYKVRLEFAGFVQGFCRSQFVPLSWVPSALSSPEASPACHVDDDVIALEQIYYS